MSLSPDAALERLRAGNARYVADAPVRVQSNTADLRASLAEGQAPFAVLLGCSDSRVPVEEVFDQAAGDLFVIRVAGNVATPSQIGSAEFGVDVLGCRLVVVLGHTGCGAVHAALGAIDTGTVPDSPNLAYIVDRIRPALRGLGTPPDGDPRVRLAEAVRANIVATVAEMASSRTLRSALDRGEVLIVGAEYDLPTGRVLFLEE